MCCDDGDGDGGPGREMESLGASTASMAFGGFARPVVNARSALPKVSRSRAPSTRALLARTLEREIIPRLLASAIRDVAERSAGPRSPERTALSADAIRNLADIAVARSGDDLIDAARALGSEAGSMAEVFVGGLGPAAALLGARWESDEATFLDVTIGLARIEEAVRALAAETAIARSDVPAARILLAPAPGEQHTLGLVILDEVLRGEGIDSLVASSAGEALEFARREWFDVVGYSAAGEASLAALPRSISRLRYESCNPDILVMVGGPALLASPHRALDVGADGTAADPRETIAFLREAMRAKGAIAPQRNGLDGTAGDRRQVEVR